MTSEKPINFFYEDTDFQLVDEDQYIDWLGKVAEIFSVTLEKVTYIMCSDEYLLGINQQYLEHDYYTDIITFPYKQGEIIESDIFLSIDRVKDNAKTESVPFEQELLRVMAHGILHLAGYGDKTDEDAAKMREMEEVCMSLF